MPGLVC